MSDESFFEKLQKKMDQYVHLVYAISKNFPKDELYGVTSQLRRASLSVVLNFIEGYARKSLKMRKNFWDTAYGSLQESKYLVRFAREEKYCSEEEFKSAQKQAEEIGAMLWTVLQKIQTNDF